MRVVRTCDFCDREAIGTVEVVPPALEPTETEQRRVVVCEACHARLETLLEPFLGRLLEGGDSTDASLSAASTEGREADVDESAGAITIEPGRGQDRMATGVSLEGEVGDDRLEETGTGDEAGDDAANDGGEDADPGPVRASETDADGDEDGSAAQAPPEAAAATDDRSQPPAAYGKVLRLLRNRELPMARSDVEGLAAGAYDLEAPEVEAVIDHAISQGKLREDGNQLRRP